MTGNAEPNDAEERVLRIWGLTVGEITAGLLLGMQLAFLAFKISEGGDPWGYANASALAFVLLLWVVLDDG